MDADEGPGPLRLAFPTMKVLPILLILLGSAFAAHATARVWIILSSRPGVVDLPWSIIPAIFILALAWDLHRRGEEQEKK